MLVNEYTDEVCLLFSACAQNFNFLLIEDFTVNEDIREPVDGILGLARGKDPYLWQQGEQNDIVSYQTTEINNFVEAFVN